MGRRKLEIKRIADKTSRQVTFCKRRSGLAKKATELSVLCEADVLLMMFSDRGKLFEYSSSKNPDEILERYQSSDKADHAPEEQIISFHLREKESRPLYSLRKRSPHECELSEANIFGSTMTSSSLLERVQRKLEETHLDQLSATDLVQLENEIDDTLKQTKSRKTQLMLQSIEALKEKEVKLREENNHLVAQVAAVGNHRQANAATQANTQTRPLLQLLF